jgi:uncharacterized membrane protein
MGILYPSHLCILSIILAYAHLCVDNKIISCIFQDEYGGSVAPRVKRSFERSFERRVKEVLKEAELRKVSPILDFIAEHGEISPEEARNAVRKSEATVWRYLKMLCERGVLESAGNTNAIKYFFRK